MENELIEGPKVPVTIKLPEKMNKFLSTHKQRTGQTKSGLIAIALIREIERAGLSAGPQAHA